MSVTLQCREKVRRAEDASAVVVGLGVAFRVAKDVLERLWLGEEEDVWRDPDGFVVFED